MPALAVLKISMDPSAFFTSQVQPEPKLVTADWVNCFLSSSNEPNVALMVSAKAPVGSPPVGLGLFQ